MLIHLLLCCVFFSRHQQLTKLLSRYINEPIHHKPRESHGEYLSRVSLILKSRLTFTVVTMIHLLFSPVLYFWILFFPTLSGAAILLIAAMLGGYGGIICSLLFPCLARSIFTQYHRMTTYQRSLQNLCASLCERFDRFLLHRWCIIHLPSRLPNPIYLGTLLAGLFHSLLCFYGKLMPNILKNCAHIKSHVHSYLCVILLVLPCWANSP